MYIYTYAITRLLATARRAPESRDAALKSKLNPETDASYTLKIDLDAARSRDRKETPREEALEEIA